MQKAIDEGFIDLAWQYFEQAWHSEMSRNCEECPRRPPSTHKPRLQGHTARITTDGEESGMLVKTAQFARRLRDWGESRGRLVYKKLARDVASISRFLELGQDQVQALWIDPLGMSESLLKRVKQKHSNASRRDVREWRSRMLDKHRQPTPAFYRWLRNRSPPPPILVKRDDDVVTEITNVLATHRRYWEGIGVAPTPADEWACLRNYVRTTSVDSPRHTASHVLKTAKLFKKKSAAGMDCVPAQLLGHLTEGAASALALLYNGIEELGLWPTPQHRCRITLLLKPSQPPERVNSWRPIT
eukprot:6456223-Amphidinium_carterae.1